MFVRLLVLWIYLVATSLHMVGVFATSLNGCRETPAQVRVLSAEVDLRFEYDALGRRVAKINEYGKAENHKITRFLWDGNVPLHEWSYPLSERPETIDDSDGKRSYASPEPQTELTTWIFDEGTFVPSAKLVGERRYSIISDYLGTPIEAYDEEGKRVWARVLDIYGRTRSEVGEAGFIPFLYQGQYLDRETGLAYNRFRYYSPETGAYISQDPIRLEAGLTNLYAYVHDVNAWVDPWGLSILSFIKRGGPTFEQYKKMRGGTKTLGVIETVDHSGRRVMQRISVEFHHMFISQRWQKRFNLPNWLVNNRINVWKLNTIQHAILDKYRFQFLRKGLKDQVGWLKKYNMFSNFIPKDPPVKSIH